MFSFWGWFLFFLFCFCVCVCVSLCAFLFFILYLPFVLGFCLSVHFLSFFLSFFFFLSFLPHRVACKVSLFWSGLEPEPLKWEIQVQNAGSPENSKPQVILIGESSSRGLHLNTKTRVHPMASNLQCWMPHAKQLAGQEHNPTH